VTGRGSGRRPVPRRAREARKFAAVGQLASGIAHEINTPTQYIGDNLRFLLDAFEQLVALLPAGARENASPELAYLLEEIPSAVTQSLDGVAQVGHIVGAVKRFVAARVGEVAQVDLNQAVESVLTLTRNEWKYVAHVVRDFDPALPLVPCAEAELRQVVLALVVEAARAIASTPSSAASATGRIVVATRRDGGCVELSVADTGAAIPDGVRECGSGPVYAAERTGRERSLAFAHYVVAGEHRGTIRVESAAGCGTTVVLRLPLECRGLPEDAPAGSRVAQGSGNVA
jgi:signal transduction histidine kinase